MIKRWLTKCRSLDEGEKQANIAVVILILFTILLWCL